MIQGGSSSTSWRRAGCRVENFCCSAPVQASMEALVAEVVAELATLGFQPRPRQSGGDGGALDDHPVARTLGL